MVARPHPVEEVPIDLVLTLPVVFLQVDHGEKFPQVSQGMSQGMLLVGGLFKDISCLDRLELVEITKDEHRDAAKHIVNHGDLSEPEVQIVEEICGDHADLIDDDAPQVPEQQPFLCPLALGHGEEGCPKFEAKKAVQCLAPNVGRCGASEGGEHDIRAAGVIAGFLEGLCHHGVDGVDHPRLAGACASMDYHQGWRGLGELLVGGGQWEGDNPLGVVEGHGEHLLLPRVQLPGLFNLK